MRQHWCLNLPDNQICRFVACPDCGDDDSVSETSIIGIENDEFKIEYNALCLNDGCNFGLEFSHGEFLGNSKSVSVREF